MEHGIEGGKRPFRKGGRRKISGEKRICRGRSISWDLSAAEELYASLKKHSSKKTLQDKHLCARFEEKKSLHPLRERE